MINELLGKDLENRSKIETRNHKKSGLLSPSKFAYTTREAVLQMLEVPAKRPDDRLLRIFERGKILEQYIIDLLEKTTKEQPRTQEETSYLKAKGYSDIIWDNQLFEIKSVSCNKIRRIKKENEPQLSHAIQTAFYLLGNNMDQGTLVYIVPDTLEVKEFVINAQAYKSELDYRILNIYEALVTGKIPEHQPREDWHDKKPYTLYPEFWGMTSKEIRTALRLRYPESYKLLRDKEWRNQWNIRELTR